MGKHAMCVGLCICMSVCLSVYVPRGANLLAPSRYIRDTMEMTEHASCQLTWGGAIVRVSELYQSATRYKLASFPQSITDIHLRPSHLSSEVGGD